MTPPFLELYNSFGYPFAEIKRQNVKTVSIQFIFAIFAGSLSAYLAHKSGKNPLKWLAIGAALGFFGILPIFFMSMKKPARASKTRVPRVKFYMISGPADKFWYYLDQSQNQFGPMSYTALTNAWKERKIDGSNYVWHEDLPEWKPLQHFIKTHTDQPS